MNQLLHIGGKYVEASEARTFPVSNPMTGEKLYDSAAASGSDYRLAIEGAQEAFASWSAQSPSTRRSILLKAADIIEVYVNQGALELMATEVSAPRTWGMTNIKGTAGMFREAASLATHIRGEVVPTEKPGVTALIERRPVGVVFSISPWNAPMILTARAVATPLICGNTVVLKPSELSTKSQGLVIRALSEAGLPAGCVQYLPTSPQDAPEVTELAIKHPHVRRVNFTGSDRVGRIIAGTAATQLKQCVLELGGKAPVIVLGDADIDKAVEAVVFGGFSYSGQICMSTERVLVHRSIYDDFRSRLLKRVEGMKCGNHLEQEDVSITGLFTPSSATRILGLVRDAVSAGAKLIAGDQTISGPNKTILQPHVLENVDPTMAIFQQETFGPILVLSSFDSDGEAVGLANNSEFSLTASVFSRDTMRALRISRQVRSGSCHVNAPTIYMESTLPNGGLSGSSGYGRFGGMAGVEEFTDKQIVTLAEPASSYPI